ncbi:hypothetical protein OSL58_24215, partial [Escherichia coli]|nr:hypothetical protein [Escherichia coli]
SGKNIIRWLLKKRTNGSVRYCQYTSHRFPAGLAGIIPQNASGLGDPDKARTTYGRDEVTPVCRKFMQAVNSDPEIPPSLHLNFTLEDVENVVSALADEK